jgi:cyclophilin family peptidyl-prolyl cis-trans isomerase
VLATSCDPAAPLAGATDAGSLEAGSVEAGAVPVDDSARLPAILTAEHKRVAELVLPSDLQSRDARVRRAAARALARIGGEASRAGLLRALADEDGDVVAWAAYGLGFFCKGFEDVTASALVARSLAWAGQPVAAPPNAALDAFGAIARAVGRCAAETSEPTLTAWLAGPKERAVAAAYGLGDLAAVKKRLREETLVALLGLAAGSASSPPVPEALFAIGRLENVPVSVIERIRQVATARLAELGPARQLAVRALSRGGDEAAAELARVVASPGMFTASERSEAARGLKRLKIAGQRALEPLLPALAPSSDPVAMTGLVGEDLGVLLEVLAALDAPGGARKLLRDLAALPPPPSAPPAILRRVAWIRCLSAKLVAGSSYTDPVLVACDVAGSAAAKSAGSEASPDAGAPDAAGGGAGPPASGASIVTSSIGARAIVDVLGRGELTGARLEAWRGYATGGDIRAREAAIELLATHAEVKGAAAVLALALAAKEPGLVGTAAEVITKQPQRASEDAGRAADGARGKRGKKRRDRDKPPPEPVALQAPSPAIVKALVAALAPPSSGAPEPESVDALIDAAGALALKDALPRLEALCRSPQPTTREHAEKAIGLIAGGKKVTCSAPPEGGEAPPELASLASGPVTLAFETDVGSLSMSLDPAIAPVTVARVVELVRSGYYRGMVVHRVVPGFVTQFGAPFGDGFGGPPGRAPLRCETSPIAFDPLRVGVALSGRDTGSSQLFVTHGVFPHLDGNYALIGTASGPWAAFVDGDLIREVTVRP